MIAIDLINQQIFDTDPKAIQQINITGNIKKHNKIFHIRRSKINYIKFFSRKCESIVNSQSQIHFDLIKYQHKMIQ